MRSLSCRSKFLLGGALSLACVASASAQVSSQATGAASATLRPGGLREGLTTTTLSEKADAEVGGAGTTEPSLVRDADAAQQGFFRTFQDGIIRVPKIGYGEGQFRVAAPLGPTAGLPLFGFASRPEEAQFKLGNFYLQVFSLSTSALVSDNINLVQVGRKTDEIAIVRLQTGVIYQVNEAMRLSAAGTAIWLPLKGEVGFRDPLADYSFSLAPLFQTQFTYDIPMNHLDFQVLEDFTVQSGGFGTGRAFDLLDRQANDLQDTAGRYSYRDTQAQGATDRRFRSAPSFRNVIGANASTVLPTVTRFTAGYTHENIWQARDSLGQPSSADSFVAELRSERENLRFKPFFSYTARHQEGRSGYDAATRGGFIGPITPYLDLSADMGYFLAGDSSSEGYVWSVRLINRPRERFEHELDYLRTITYPDRSIVTLVGYHAQLQASPDIILEAAVQEQNVEPIDNPNNSFGGKQFRTEGRFNYRALDRFITRFGYAWTHSVGREGTPPIRFDLHTIRCELVFAHTPTFETSILLQNERRESNFFLDSYVENVASITLTKKF